MAMHATTAAALMLMFKCLTLNSTQSQKIADFAALSLAVAVRPAIQTSSCPKISISSPPKTLTWMANERPSTIYPTPHHINVILVSESPFVLPFRCPS